MVYFVGWDWDGSAVHQTLRAAGRKVYSIYSSPSEALRAIRKQFPEGDVIVLAEASFGSFPQPESLRLETLELADQLSIVIRTIHTRQTPHLRSELLGINVHKKELTAEQKKKMNEIDSELMLLILENRSLDALGYLQPLTASDSPEVLIGEEVKKASVVMRSRDNAGEDNSEKIIQKYLPKSTAHEVLLNGAKTEYAAAVSKLLLAAEIVRQYGRGWKFYRKVVGNYGNGYKSMSRSEFYNSIVKFATNRELQKTDLTRKHNTNLNGLGPTEKGVHKATMKLADKALKWLWLQTA